MENLATIKLTSGEELIAIVKEGPTPLEIVVVNPVVVHKNNSALGPMLSCLLYTSPSPRDRQKSRMPSSA